MLYKSLIEQALREDLGDAGDITSNSTLPATLQASANLLTKQEGVLAGVDISAEVFRTFDPSLDIQVLEKDGAHLKPGDIVLKVSGAARSIMTAERVALNFIRHLSGVATATHQMVKLVEGTPTSIVCTRKTTPGLRALEKYAVRCGGGMNHRFGLYDAVLIKDNHIAACGSVTAAIESARKAVGHLVKIECETSNMSMVEEAVSANADVIMLDNMTPAEVAGAVQFVAGRAKTEASGGITHQTVRSYAEAGVDLISLGWITHSAPNLDFSLDL